MSRVENLLKKESASPKTIDGLKIVTLQKDVVSDSKCSSALPLDWRYLPIDFESAFKELIIDLYDFLKTRKKYWLAPLILTIVFMGTLVIVTQGSVIAPFIYTLF